MPYTNSEVSQHSGKPTELFKFEGTYANFFYTSGSKKVRYPDTVDGDWYLPIAMRRSEINCGTQEDDGNDLTIELSVQNEIVQVYGFQASPPSLELTIYRFHDLSEVISYWTGPINDIQVSNGVATIRSPSTMGAALEANLPNVFFQSPCNHVLYDARCKVPYADWSDPATVLAVAGRVLTLDSVGTLDGKLIGGEVLLPSGERRMITAQGPVTLPGADPEDEADDIEAFEVIVNFPFSQLAVDEVVTLAAGCDLAYRGDCKLKFNNNRNFGGFPFIPSANPFADGIDPSVVPLPDNTCTPICEPCPQSTTISWNLSFNGCKTFYCPTRNWYSPVIAGRVEPYLYVINPPLVIDGVTGPSGKAIETNIGMVGGCDGSLPQSLFEHDYYNDPLSEWYQNPLAIKLQGQLLQEWGSDNADFYVTVHGANFGAYNTLQIQYGAFWCGDNIATATLTRNDCGGCVPKCACAPTILLENVELVGNVPYTFTF